MNRPLDIRVAEMLAELRWIALDVDGVLTDGRLVVDGDGTEIRSFSIRDGLGIKMAQHAGLGFAIISGRNSPVVARRAEELGIEEVHLGVHRKADCLRGILERHSLPTHATCFVGDDVIDLPAMRVAGMGVAPADADPAVRAGADYVTAAVGGAGVVRELTDLILRQRGEWDDVVARLFPH